MNKTRVLWLLATAIITGAAVPVVRQSNLNSQLLQAIGPSATSATDVRNLIHRGADPNAGQAQSCDSALFRAIASSDPKTILVLLNAGASVRPQGQAHISPALALACQLGPRGGLPNETEYRELFIKIRSRGASLEERDSLGFTPLMRAVWSGNVPATQALLTLGANPRAKNNLGAMALEMQDQNGEVDQFERDNLFREYTPAHRSVQKIR